ncbi:unnamed protein product [Pleuronectes platessa]|uniref:Uncharacterized protein n=1 Tax=Pleuronectes platessa TaxID=8262 RepID=A0A9N7UZ30_PLEPL|nr:unnamed protein product [Pleuronectes platessa]
MGGRALLVVSVVVRLGPDPSGYNCALENVLSGDGGAACSSRKECGDRGHTPLPLPTLHCDKLLLAVDLLVVKSAPCAGMKAGWAGGQSAPPPLLFLLVVITGPLSTPTSHMCES